MLDDDDLDFTILAADGGGAIIVLVIICVVAYFVWGNHKTCDAMACPNKGEVSQLLNNQCLCVTPAIAVTPTGQ